ncbi:hypothetical protein NRP93_003726 [Clostridium botulinum]|nr:hypothetical protein [Clostridium botulinum]
MIIKRIKAGLLLGCLATMLISTTAFAKTYTSGRSTGGIKCNGSIDIHNSYVIGATNTGTSSGVKAVNIKIFAIGNRFTQRDYSGYAPSVSGKLNAPHNYSVLSVRARHSFSSKKYGTWYGTTSYN